MRASPGLLRILLVKLVVDLSALYTDGIEPGSGEGFQWICGLRAKHSKPEIDEIANIGKDRATREVDQGPFGEQLQAIFFRHSVNVKSLSQYFPTIRAGRQNLVL